MKKLDVIKNIELIDKNDFNFLINHQKNFAHRFETRSLFRSDYEMRKFVLDEKVHPTPDSKYWQAIGEQVVQIQELVDLSYENRKLKCDIKEKELFLKQYIEIRDEHTQIKAEKLEIEIEQLKFQDMMQKKVAKERLSEIKNWETIIKELEPQLRYGKENFEKHHPERYALRERRNYQEEDIKQAKSAEVGCTFDFNSTEEMLKTEPFIDTFFNHNIVRILVGCPHRIKEDKPCTNLNKLQAPAAMSADLESPYGYPVAEARNLIVQKALTEDYDYIFFIDDDLIIPNNTLVILMNHLKNGYDIAGGFYYRKYKPVESCSMVEDARGRPNRIELGKELLIENPLVLCSGCTLFKTEVFENLEKPWYKQITVKERLVVTEDTYFCQRIKELNKLKSVIDTSIQCIHVDKENGIFYGNENIIKNNQIIEKYRQFYAV